MEEKTKPESEVGKQVMVYTRGSGGSFRCTVNDGRGPCNCNVFTRLDGSKYRCNSCNTVYEAC